MKNANRRACKCELSKEDKIAVLAMRIDTQSDEFMGKMVDLQLSAMDALFENFLNRMNQHGGKVDSIALSQLVASVLEAAKRCGSA